MHIFFQSVFFYLLFTVLQFLCDCWIVLVCAVPRLLTLPNLLDPWASHAPLLQVASPWLPPSLLLHWRQWSLLPSLLMPATALPCCYEEWAYTSATLLHCHSLYFVIFTDVALKVTDYFAMFHIYTFFFTFVYRDLTFDCVSISFCLCLYIFYVHLLWHCNNNYLFP